MTTNKPVETHAAAELSSESAEKLLRAESTPRPEQGADQATSVSITSHRAAQEILAPEDDEDFQAFLAECGLPPSKPRVSAANADASAAFSSSPDTTTAATTASKTSATASKTTRVAAGTAGLADSVGSEPVRKGASNSSSQRVKPDAGAEGPDPNNAEDYAAFQAFLAECHGTSNSSQATSKQATPSEGVAVGAAVGATAKSKGASAHTCGDISGVGQGQAGSSKFTDNSASLGSHNASGSATGIATGTNGSEPSGAGLAPASVALGAVVGAAANISGTASDSSDSSDSSGATGASGTASAPQKASRPRMKRARRKHEFWRSLQFRVMMIFAFAGMIATATMGVMSYLKSYYNTQEFIDEELSQISQVVINYRMVLPRRWESPRHMRERVLRLRNDHGRIIVEYGTIEVPTGQGQDPQGQAAPQQMPRGQGMGMGMGPRYGMQGMHGMHRGAGAAGSGAYAGAGNAAGAGAGYGAGGAAPLPEDTLPSIEDLHRFNYDIMIAPLYGRPGDALYIPPGVSDGFYTVMVADQRVRAVVATNLVGQRFVVARPLSSMENINRQALISSLWQFLGINLLFIPLLMISVRMMFLTLNKIAKSLYKRTDDDLGPVIPENNRGFVPSELDGFVIALNRLFSRVNESIQSKRRFIADAAHEMRTPLTALSLQAEALELEDLSPSARRKVQRLKEGISRERELMTALLTLAREQNRVELNLETIDVLQLFTKLIDEQGLLADNRNIDLGVEGEVQYSIVTDRLRLMRVMSNLVSNAIKYTPEGGRIDLMAEQLSDGRLQLIVQDNGPGIPPEHLKHILEPFYRVHGDRSAVQGTGLGLAIVKASCDSIKAELKFANATPHGLIASVIVPPLTAADAAAAAAAAASEESEQSGNS